VTERGLCGGFYSFRQQSQKGQTNFCDEMRPDSDKSVRERAAPIGYTHVQQGSERCRCRPLSLIMTPDGINAAVAAALMKHYLFMRWGLKESRESYWSGMCRGMGKRRGVEKWFKGRMSVRAPITAVGTSSDE